tara:strand:- start:3219 stop:4133 length:915 start_codon:yes stop_codon:yes gene_type:complete
MNKNHWTSKYLTNEINIPESKDYCAIFGTNPSNGARSPKLWNSTFNALGIDRYMYSLDVPQHNVLPFLQELQNDIFFKGGAIAVPYKITTSNFLQSDIAPNSIHIGAINSLYRDGSNKLIGTNTDGEGALKSLVSKIGNVKDKSVLIIGSGGAALAVINYVANEIDDKKKCYLAARTTNKLIKISTHVKANVINISEIYKLLPDINIIINCTSIGFGDQVNQTPISLEDMKLINKTTFIYDIIYQPKQTKLLKNAAELELKYMNGLSMNLEQAVLGFYYSTSISYQVNIDDIRYHMINCINNSS